MNIRHGDMALIGIAALPEHLNLQSSETTVLLTGSGGNPHAIKTGSGVFYPHTSGQIVGYLTAKDGCILLHKDHGMLVENSELREALIPAGVYEVHCQVEDTHEGMRVVED